MDKIIKIYTDGACSGNPGPMGIGVVMVYGGMPKTFSEYKGDGTSNQAEILAVIDGLGRIKNPEKFHVKLYTDSQLVHGFLAKGWKASANVELVQKMRMLASKCKNIDVVKVRAHSGDIYNELADKLAVRARKRGK